MNNTLKSLQVSICEDNTFPFEYPHNCVNSIFSPIHATQDSFADVFQFFHDYVYHWFPPMGRDPNWGREAHFIGSQASLKIIRM